jgi:pimeloyl-ACP methyl ester carboxylesterase
MKALLTGLAAASLFAVLWFGPSGAPATNAQPGIDWEPCGGRVECGTLAVPLDYGRPAGRTIELSLIRIPARDPARRIGILIANPGGPGASAIEFTRIWVSLLSNDIRNRFDIVAFDPRGVGESTPIICHDRLQELVAFDPDPDTSEEWEVAKRVSRAFAEDCGRKYGDILPYLGTKNVARDMDRVREVLGEEKLNYVGYSYGTSIGAVYAEMFPSRIRAMVLDGGTDLSLGYEDTIRTQIIGFERAFQAYLDDCAARRCAIARDGDPRALVNAIIARAEEKPLPSSRADRPAGPGEVQLGIISALYSKLSWGALTTALEQANRGDGTGLVQLADAYLQREPNGEYPNLIEANAAVNYVDEECPKDPEALRGLGDVVAREAPTFGRSASTSGLVCAYWPAKPDPVSAPRGAGAPPIVVIATTNDPATPYEWGEALSQQLESGVLVTYRGEGHTIYAQGSGCIDEVVDAYLVGLAVPGPGTTCGDGPPPPGTSASTATPPTEAPGTPVPGSTSTPPIAPSTGQADGDGEADTFWHWVFGLGFFALALGFFAAGFILHRRQ